MRPWPNPCLSLLVLLLVAVTLYVFANLLSRQAREAISRIEQWRRSLPNRLPFWVKLIGWLCVWAAGFNLVFHPFLVLSPNRRWFYPQLDRPGGWVLSGFLYLLLVPLLVFGIGLLRRRDWARKGIILWQVAALAVVVVLATFQPFGPYQRFLAQESFLTERILTVVWDAVVVSLIVVYLMSRKVRKLFAGDSPDR